MKPLIDQAREAHDCGRFETAAALCTDILEQQPEHADALCLLASMAESAGNADLAVAFATKATGCGTPAHRYHDELGVLLQRIGRLSEALVAFDDAVRLCPEFVQAHYNRGVVLQKLGRTDEALGAYDRALQSRPAFAEAHLNRGRILQQIGRLDHAGMAYTAALRARPDYAPAHLNRGNVLQMRGRMGDALTAWDQALALAPDYAEAHYNRGNVLKAQGRIAEALAAFGDALRFKPDYTEAHHNYLFCMIYDASCRDFELLRAHRTWGDGVSRSTPTIKPFENRPDVDKTLRVGFVSADFNRHPVGQCLAPLLDHADPNDLEILCYSGVTSEDDLTRHLREKAAEWRSTVGMPDGALAETIRADRVDILIDLAGHTAGNRLTTFALKPAPVQASWLGYPCTTGLAAIDYVLMDEAAVPAGGERWFVEDVVRLPETRFCYAPPEYAPEPSAPPSIERGQVTFGSFNNLTKVGDDVVALWARLLNALPTARLLLKWKTLGNSEEGSRQRRRFAAHGIAPERIELRAAAPHPQMLAEYADVDVALDPFPYSGGLTSLEALWQGVPVVTLPATRAVSRQTVGFLRALDLGDLIATNPQDYIERAIALASDDERLGALRAGLRSRMRRSPLCDGPRFARHFEAALRTMWRRWCTSETPSRKRRPLGAGQASSGDTPVPLATLP